MLVSLDKRQDYAPGMTKADGSEPPPGFKELIDKEKRGKMIMKDTCKVLDKKYKMKE